MGYDGVMVLTRSETLVTQLPHIELLGFTHRLVREFGGGWQMLDTHSWARSQGFAGAVELVARAWGQPVLLAYVTSSDCAQLHWATPAGSVQSAHLPEPSIMECVNPHGPETLCGKPASQVEAEITAWASVAGLSVSPRRLAAVVSHANGPDRHVRAEELALELVRALGFADFPPARPRAFDPRTEPLDQITGVFAGLGFEAYKRMRNRADGYRREPEAAWETPALQLRYDINAALFGDGRSFSGLVVRAEWLIQAHRAAEDGREPQPFAGGQVAPDSAEEAERRRLGANRSWYPDRYAGAAVWPELA